MDIGVADYKALISALLFPSIFAYKLAKVNIAKNQGCDILHYFLGAVDLCEHLLVQVTVVNICRLFAVYEGYWSSHSTFLCCLVYNYQASTMHLKLFCYKSTLLLIFILLF